MTAKHPLCKIWIKIGLYPNTSYHLSSWPEWLFSYQLVHLSFHSGFSVVGVVLFSDWSLLPSIVHYPLYQPPYYYFDLITNLVVELVAYYTRAKANPTTWTGSHYHGLWSPFFIYACASCAGSSSANAKAVFALLLQRCRLLLFYRHRRRSPLVDVDQCQISS